MSIIDRYVLGTILGATLVVLMVLLSLAVFVEFFGQMGDIGEGNYTMAHALVYVALRVPRLGIEMLPAAALLGGLLGLGGLAARSELIVMQAAGVSRLQLGRSTLLTGLLLMMFMATIGEYFAPALSDYARQMRAFAKYEELVLEGPNAWVRDGNVILNMRTLGADRDGAGIYVFQLDPERRLSAMGRAESATADGAATWILNDYGETRFEPDRIVGDFGSRRLATERLTEDLLHLSMVRPVDLNARGLWRYVEYLRANRLDATTYEVAYWSRLAHITSAAVMPLLALPFVFGSLRSAGTGARMMVGVLIGLGYFLVSRVLADGAVVFDMSPIVMAWTPTAALLLFAMIGLARAR